MLLYLVRHGDPVYATDSLTERGMLQAEAVAKRMAAEKIDELYCSPMGRARLTAEPTCRLLGLDCKIEEWTHEIYPGDLYTPFPDGVKKSLTRVQNTYYRENGNIDISYYDSYSCPGFDMSNMKEAVSYIEEHGKEFLQRLGYKEENGIFRILEPNDKKIALFCHGAFTRAWLSVLLHIPIHIVWSGMGITHTGITLIEFKNNENGYTAPKCLYISDIGHLYAHGPDTIYDFHTPEQKEVEENI